MPTRNGLDSDSFVIGPLCHLRPHVDSATPNAVCLAMSRQPMALWSCRGSKNRPRVSEGVGVFAVCVRCRAWCLVRNLSGVGFRTPASSRDFRRCTGVSAVLPYGRTVRAEDRRAPLNRSTIPLDYDVGIRAVRQSLGMSQARFTESSPCPKAPILPGRASPRVPLSIEIATPSPNRFGGAVPGLFRCGHGRTGVRGVGGLR